MDRDLSDLETVRAWLGSRRPRIALVLGSGLGHLADELDDAVRLGFADIPGWPRSAVAGHAGELVAGVLGGRQVLCQSGRFHAYEGHPAAVVARPVRVLAGLGVSTLILTNAAGGIRVDAGTILLISDHLNFTFRNPLTGAVQAGESRFPDMSSPYDPALRDRARQAAADAGVALAEGVYAGVAGPSYETAAEVRMLRALGADVVGMSTVLEVVTARALGLRCLGFSLVTNRAAGLTTVRLNHSDVVEAARTAGKDLGRVVRGTVELLGDP